LKKANDLEANVKHIKDVVRTQQSYAKTAGLESETTLNQILDNAIQINSSSLDRHHVKLERRIEITDKISVDQQRLLQILVNLISNAKYATMNNKSERHISIRARVHEENLYHIEVHDNGVGIPSENLTKIFQHGFTTRDEGHGFGLHGSAIAAKELGGKLTVHSDGLGQGATFVIELPLKRVEIRNETEQLAAH
jgi:C4-dicarboxylate-specific signal transduction histidine kinase